MAVTETTYTGNGSTTNYSFTFPYLKTTDIKASINGTATDAIRLFNATTVQFVNNTTDNTPTAPANNAAIRIYRETDDSKLEAEFFAGSAIKSSDLNDNFNQNLYVTQESNNKINTAWTTGDETIISTETWVSNDTRVSTTAAQDARTDSKIDTALTTDVVGGQSITITDNSPGTGQITASVTAGSIRGTELAGDAVDGTKIANDSIDSEHYVAGSIDLEHMSANSVDSNQYVDGSIDLAHMSANSVDSDQYVDGSIDRVHLASDVIDGTKLADNAVNSEHITSGAVDLAHMSVNSIDSNQYVDGSIDTEHLSDDSVTGQKLAHATIDSEHYAHGSVDHVHLSNDCIDGDNIQDDVVNSEHIAAGALDTEHYATGSITADKLNSATVITNSEQAGASANDTSFFTSSAADARYFNISSGDTIKDGQSFPDNDTTIATTAAINDRIIDLVEEVGGFVPIANETSFPNANPDVNNGTGTLVSIKALASNLTSNGSGVATIANGTVGNSTVTITGLANSTTYASTFGMIVETTSTLNTYTFHRLVPKATEVTTVSSNITNINAVANNASNINAAVSNASNINSAVSNASNINSVAGSISNVNTVAGNNSNITTVAGANSNITTVATNINNVNLTGGSIANVNTVASNLSGINSFAARYRIASSAPTSSLDEGDLYFDTTGSELKVYNGSAWQGGVTATGNLVSKSGDQMTGNLTFSGSQTVDGRDVSVDGTKLDTIETNATADQTAAEIRTLVESATDSNVFTDSDHTKLNAIEASATADQTAAEIRTLVESASDSNVFTDADHTKLNAIEASATADQTAAEIRTLVESASDSNVFTDADHSKLNGIEASATADQTAAEILTSIKTVDGTGSGLDADTVDGIHGASFLRSDADDSTSGILTIQGHDFKNHNGSNLIVQCNASSSGGICQEDSGGTFLYQLYGSASSGGIYGFLDAKWGGWDIQKTLGGALKVDINGGLQEVLHQANVGSGGALSSSSVYLSDVYCSNWVRFTGTDMGLYHSGNANHFYSDDANYWTVAYNGSSGGLRIRDNHNGSIRGYLYCNDSNEIGLLNQSGDWSLRCNSSRQTAFYGTVYPYVNNSYSLGTSGYKWSQVHATTFHGDGSNLTNLPSSGGTTPTVKTANYTAANGDMVVINGTGLTITLPSGPSAGDSVKIRILGDRYCTVARNSQNINGSAENAYIDIFDGCATFTYVDSTRGWLIGC